VRARLACERSAFVMEMMSDDLLAAIRKSNDRNWLIGCRDYNRKLGNREVVDAAEQRLRDLDLRAALRVRPEAKTVEDRVGESVRVYRELLRHKHGRNQAAGYTERAIRDHGPKGALIRTVRSGKKTDGLMLLAKHNRLDCAYEQIAIDHADEMPSDVVEIAKRTLANLAGS
jgi:hypothetical protein